MCLYDVLLFFCLQELGSKKMHHGNIEITRVLYECHNSTVMCKYVPPPHPNTKLRVNLFFFFFFLF